MDVRIETFEPKTVASVRHTGPYAQCETAWRTLFSGQDVMAAAGSKPLLIGISYDDPGVTDPAKLRYDACVAVGEDFIAIDPVKKLAIAGGDYAVVTHKGSYQGLHEVYKYLYQTWISQSGYEFKDAPPLEIYRNTPLDTKTEDLITDVCIPLASKS